ncbi:MAG: 3-dehydroquinate synthase [Candidatus Aenigmarchaeota archaeon]|nr:3-dehydroquinate synthase [Candidatus Aenigmarchaeota archaeon]
MNELFRMAVSPIENGVETQYTEIIVKPGCLSEVPEILRKPLRRYAIITDSIVARLYGYRLQQCFRKISLDAELLEFHEGEQRKSLDTVDNLVNQLGEYGYGKKDSTIIALGGGVVGDVAGLVARGYMRGIHYVQVPTTLLAQVDSSLGGKTAVNTSHGKNLFGVFYHPTMDLVDPETTLTLPERVYRSSLAEVVKYGAIDPHFRRELEIHLDSLLRKDIELVSRFVLESLIIKAFYIDKDPFDEGVRQILNFGHTIGHAVEFASDYNLTHGEAVAIGMNIEGRLAVANGNWTDREFDSLINLLKRVGLPQNIPDYLDRKKILEAVTQDKKREDDSIKFVIPSQSNPLAPVQIKMKKDDVRALI